MKKPSGIAVMVWKPGVRLILKLEMQVKERFLHVGQLSGPGLGKVKFLITGKLMENKNATLFAASRLHNSKSYRSREFGSPVTKG